MREQRLFKLLSVGMLAAFLAAMVTVIYAAPMPRYTPQTVIFPPDVSKSVNSATAKPGDTVTYTIRITASTGQLTNVTISDTLPANTQFVAGSTVISPAGAGGSTGTPPNLASGITVVTGSVVSVMFAATVDVPLAVGMSIENTAAVTATEMPTPTLASATFVIENAAPVAYNGANTTPEDTVVTGTLSATDANGDSLAYSVTQPANGTVTLVTTGGSLQIPTSQYIYTPTQNFNGEDTFTFTATDGISVSNVGVVTVTVTAVNDAPQIDTIAAQNADEQSAVTFTATASDPNDSPPDALTFSLQNAPSGASIDPVTGEFSWTPTETQGPGIYTPTVVVTDDGLPPLSDTATVVITVTEVNTAPVLAPIGDFSVDVADTLTFTAHATDADDPANALTFSLQNAPSGASIDPVTGEFSWTPNAAHGGQTYTVTVMVSDDGSPVMTDTEITHITVVNVADLQLSKSGSPLDVTAGDGELLVYTLLLDNAGPSLARTVHLTDTLPADVTFQSVTTPKTTCVYSDPVVTCDWAQIGSGEQEIITIIVTVDASATISITNMATVTSTTIDRLPDNNTAAASTTIRTAADLSITHSDTPDPVYLGEVVTYTITVDNAGPSYARNVQVTDHLSGNVSITDMSSACAVTGSDVTCALGTMTVGETRILTVAVRADGDANSTETITGTAIATSDTADPGQNIAVETTTVLPHADLALTKTAFPNPIAAGETLTYTLVVTNRGPSVATGVQLSDTLPTTATFGSASSTHGTCTGTANISCALGTLAVDESAVVTIVVTPTQLGTLVNDAAVSATTPAADRTPANNTASVSVPVTLRTDVGVAMSAAPEPVIAGETVTFTVVATNYGPSTATGVTVSDVLPAALTFSGGSAGCSATGQTVVCTLGDLAAGNSASATIQADVSAAVTGTIVNTATVSAAEFDENTGNNVTSTVSTVATVADLQLTLTDTPDPNYAGGTIAYTLSVLNAGPSDAQGVVITETVPLDFSVTSAPNCTVNGQTVTCNIGTLPAGGTVNRLVSAAIALSADGTFTATAGVSSTTADPAAANNVAAETTTVIPGADLAISLTDAPDPVTAGETLAYTLVASNLGAYPASAVTMVFTLPLNTVFLAADTGCAAAGGIVTCDIGSLAGGSMATKQVSVTVDAAASGTLNGTAALSGGEFDPEPDNNTAAETTAVTAAADLALAAVGTPQTVQTNEVFSVTFVITNAGPSVASAVTFTATVPSSFAGTYLTPSQGTCSGEVCSLGTLTAHAIATVTVTGASTATGVVQIQSQVGAATADPLPGNETAQATATVTLHYIYLPLIMKPGTHLSVFNDNTGGDVIFTVQGTPVRCTIPNNTTKFCGTFAPGTYIVEVISACGPPASFEKTYEAGEVTTRVFCR